MSKTVDQRVVEMEFDNVKFEEGVRETISSLNTLKEGLLFRNANTSMGQLNNAVPMTAMESLAASVGRVSERFSTMGMVGTMAMYNIVDGAVNAGKNLVKSLSIDQITTGFDKYAEKTSAVQTIINATGESIEVVEGHLAKLNWFTDETSFNLLDMTSNIGKFTSNGVDLETSVTAMQGIANAAALAGTGVESASHAMEGFSKAIAQGYMSRMNWNWIKTSRMDTQQFKETIIETAESMGTLIRQNGSLVTATKQTAVSFEDFESALSEGWLTKDVMLNALGGFGEFSDELYRVSSATNLTASELLEAVETFKDGTLDIKSVSESAGVSVEDLTLMLTRLNDKTLALGQKSFRAAQEAKTFAEAIDSVKDAVSTGWMNTFEILFGNYEEAKKLWTGLANTLYDIFAVSGETRNELLASWKELGGRESVINSIVNAFQALMKILTPIKQAFRDIFPPMTATKLKEITDKLEALTKRLIVTDETAERIGKTFQFLFAILAELRDRILYVSSVIMTNLTPSLRVLESVSKTIAGGLANIGYTIVGFSVYIYQLGRDSGLLSGVWSALSLVIDGLRYSLNVAGSAFTKFATIFSGLFTSRKIDNVTNSMDGSTKVIGRFGEQMKNLFSMFNNSGTRGIDSVTGSIDRLFEVIRNADLGMLGAGVSLVAIFVLVRNLTKLIGTIKKVLSPAETMVDTIKELFGSITSVFTTFAKNVKYNNYLKVAISIGILATSLALLSSIDIENLGTAFLALSASLLGFLAITTVVSKMGNIRWGGLISSLISFSVAVLLIIKALQRLSEVPNISSSLLSFVTVIGALGAVITLLSSPHIGIDGPTVSKLLKLYMSSILVSSIITSLAKAFDSFKNISVKDVSKSLLSLSISMVAISTFAKMIPSINVLSSVGSIVAMSTSLLLLSSVVQDMTKFTGSEFQQGIIRTAVLLGTIIPLLSLLSKFSGVSMVGTALSIGALSASLMLLVNPIKLLGSMEASQLAKGLLSVAAALVILSSGLVLISYITGGGAAILGVSAAMITLSVAINLLIIPLGLLTLIPWTSIATSMAVLLLAFAGFGLLSTVLAPAIPAILGLSLAMGAFGLGLGVLITSLSLGMLALVTFSTASSVSAAVIVSVFSNILIGIQNILPMLRDTLLAFVRMFVEVGVELQLLLIQGAETLGIVLATALLSALAVVFNTLKQALHLEGLSLRDGVYKVTMGLLDAILGGLAAIWNGIIIRIQSFNAETEALMRQAGIDLVNGLIRGIKSRFIEPLIAIGELGASMIQSFKDKFGIASPSKVMAALGENITNSLGTGVVSKKDTAVGAIEDVAGSMIDKFGAYLPSFRTMGQNSINSFIEGLTSKHIKLPSPDDLVSGGGSGGGGSRKETPKKTPQKPQVDPSDIFGNITKGGGGGGYKAPRSSGGRGGGGGGSASAPAVAAKTEYEKAKEWISLQQELDQLSLEQELSKWKSTLKVTKKGSDDYIRLLNHIKDTENKIRQESYDNSVAWINAKKSADDMSLIVELEAWERVQARYAQGTTQRTAADKEYARVKKDIVSKMKQIDQEYARGVEDLNRKLVDDIKAVSDAYANELKSRTDSIFKTFGLFDEITAKGDVTSEKLIANLKSQVDAMRSWSDNLDMLSYRGISEGLLQELTELGPRAWEEIQALTSMTDSELSTYVSLWDEKYSIAARKAEEQLVSLADSTQASIAVMRKTTATELDKLKADWLEKVKDIVFITPDEYEEMSNDIINVLKTLKERTAEQFVESNTGVKKIVNEEQWDVLGLNIVQGVSQGVEENRGLLFQAMKNLAAQALSAARSELQIASPSKAMYEIGTYVVQGFANALNSAASYNQISGAMRYAMSAVGTDVELRPRIIPIIDLDSAKKELFDFGQNRIKPLYSNSLADELFTSDMARNSGGAVTNEETTIINNDVTIHAVVREEADIEKISESIYDLGRRRGAGKGN